MSKEDDELKELSRLIAECLAQAKSADDLGVKLIDDVSSRFDDYVAKQRIAENAALKTGAPTFVPRWISNKIIFLRSGLFSKDPLAQAFAEGLERRGVISRAQHRLLNTYSMLRIDPDGVGLIRRPNSSDYFRAKSLLAGLIIASFLALILVWEVLSSIVAGIPLSYAIGAGLGYLLRSAFDRAWGRDRLATYIKNRAPWLTEAIA